MGQPHKVLLIEVHLLGRTMLLSQLVSSITWYLYPWIFIFYVSGSFTNAHFIEVHLLDRTLSISQLGTSITWYLYPQIFIYHGYGLTTQNPSLWWLFIFNKGFTGGNFTQWGPFLLEGGMVRMENGIHPCYPSTHGIYPMVL